VGELDKKISICQANLNEELEKRKRYRVDDSRRTHNYDEFITTFLLMLAEQGKLPELLERGLSNSSNHVSMSVEDDAPKSPSAFFAELQNTFKELSDKSPRKTPSSKSDLAEFLPKDNVSNNSHTQNLRSTSTSPQKASSSSSVQPKVNVPQAKQSNSNATSRTSQVTQIKVKKSTAHLVAANARRRKKGKRPSLTMRIKRR